ncbi:DUF2267 domain-containing protein [Actinokineospora sp. PR83]|uniref:DUF2267 domain-containing protein n=1 Tax=Actinokineospora sp. PR83 TaxID=2884908 RepID=UPI001F27FDF4|nr:DUF2267 domain-containing protein [Actinokineospora sp. PR83]MCG8915550.1 DUF2267 domain-containing protein [Actinokineospora sp. PR83]
MTVRHSSAFDTAAHRAHRWVDQVAAGFPTADEVFVHRVVRAWLHLVRDELAVPAAARFASQLPELLRGTFYEGWKPEHVPYRSDPRTFSGRFAEAAGIRGKDVPEVLSVVTSRLDLLMSGSLVDKVLGTLPAELRDLLRGEAGDS